MNFQNNKHTTKGYYRSLFTPLVSRAARSVFRASGPVFRNERNASASSCLAALAAKQEECGRADAASREEGSHEAKVVRVRNQRNIPGFVAAFVQPERHVPGNLGAQADIPVPF